MGNDTKQQLDKELALLTESHEQGIISGDEFEKQRQRIEKSISELENAVHGQQKPEGILSGEKGVVVKELDSKELMAKESSSEIIKKAEEQKREEEELSVKAGAPQRGIRNSESFSMAVKEEKEEKKQIKKKPAKKKTEKETENAEKPAAQEIQEEKKEFKKQEPKPEGDEQAVKKHRPAQHSEKKPKKHTFLLILALISIVIAGYYGYYYFSADYQTTLSLKQEPKPACLHDSDCYKESMFGFCINPGAKEAYCSFREDAHVKLTLLNNKNCKLCATETTMEIINGLFPNIEIIPVDISSSEGKALAKGLEISSLPAYILDSNAANASNYNKFRQALIEKKGAFIVKPKAAGSVYYFNEAETKNRLELITMGNDTAASKSIANIEAFLDAFEGKVDFVHTANPGKSVLEKYDIATFPVFIANSQYKFSGILPANIVKDKFCAVNQMKECSAALSSSLK